MASTIIASFWKTNTACTTQADKYVLTQPYSADSSQSAHKRGKQLARLGHDI